MTANPQPPTPQTKAVRERIPPESSVAVAHDDVVKLLVSDWKSADDALLAVLGELVSLAETQALWSRFELTGGLIDKPVPLSQAWRWKEQLEAAGASVRFVRPDQTVAGEHTKPKG